MTSGCDLVHFNLAIAKNRLDHSSMAGFTSQLDAVNRLAEASPGFVWTATDGEAGDPVATFGTDLALANISTWRFVGRSSAVRVRRVTGVALRRRRDWFQAPVGPVMRFGDGTKTPEQVRQWINRWIDDLYPRWGFGMWAVVRQCDERAIGYCGLSRFPDRVGSNETEIGFRLARPFWGRGFASEAVAAARDHAWAALKLPKLVAFIDPANLASTRVVEKAGFTYERDAMLEGYDHPDRVYSVVRPVAANASRGVSPA